MRGKDYQYILDTVDNEGFGYAFLHYSDFLEIKDEEFHKLRENFEEAAHALADYIDVTI